MYGERTGGLIPGAGCAVLPVLLVAFLAACGGEEGGPGGSPEVADTAAPATGPEPAETRGDTTGPDSGLRRWVGTLHPPVPEGVAKRAGAVVTPPGGDAADAEHGLVHAVVGGARQLWLSELVRREPGGEPVWRVVDVVEVGPVGPEERVMIYGCRSPDRASGVAAVMRDEDRETLTDARRAWWVDGAAGELERIPPDGVRCENPGVHAP